MRAFEFLSAILSAGRLLNTHIWLAWQDWVGSIEVGPLRSGGLINGCSAKAMLSNDIARANTPAT
jgi:hypothetical protein